MGVTEAVRGSHRVLEMLLLLPKVRIIPAKGSGLWGARITEFDSLDFESEKRVELSAEGLCVSTADPTLTDGPAPTPKDQLPSIGTILMYSFITSVWKASVPSVAHIKMQMSVGPSEHCQLTRNIWLMDL